MTILIELSDCWGLRCLIQILGIIEKKVPRGPKQVYSMWKAKFTELVLPACFLSGQRFQGAGGFIHEGPSCLKDYIKVPGSCRAVSGKHVVCTAGSVTLKHQLVLN